MEKPVLSPNFTIDDIHTLREYNYEMTKHMTDEERMDYYNKVGFSLVWVRPPSLQQLSLDTLY